MTDPMTRPLRAEAERLLRKDGRLYAHVDDGYDVTLLIHDILSALAPLFTAEPPALTIKTLVAHGYVSGYSDWEMSDGSIRTMTNEEAKAYQAPARRAPTGRVEVMLDSTRTR